MYTVGADVGVLLPPPPPQTSPLDTQLPAPSPSPVVRAVRLAVTDQGRGCRGADPRAIHHDKATVRYLPERAEGSSQSRSRVGARGIQDPQRGGGARPKDPGSTRYDSQDKTYEATHHAVKRWHHAVKQWQSSRYIGSKIHCHISSTSPPHTPYQPTPHPVPAHPTPRTSPPPAHPTPRTRYLTLLPLPPIPPPQLRHPIPARPALTWFM